MGQKQLVVVNQDHPAVRQVATTQVAALLDNYLGGTELSGKKIIADMLVQLTENPKLQECTPESLFKCAVFAAQRKRSFGAFGVWMVPRDTKAGKMAVPQLSYQAKNTSARERGAFSIQSEVVLEGERFEVIKENGVIVGIEHTIDYLKRPLPTEQNVLAGYGVIVQNDGKRFYKVVTKHEIMRARNTSSTRRDSATPWNTDYEAMCRKTIEARMQEDYVGDFTQYGGGIGGGPPAMLETREQGTAGGDLADALMLREEEYVPTPFEQATMMVETSQTPEQVDALKQNAEFVRAWKACTKEDQDAIADAAKARRSALQEEAKQEGQGGGDTGEAASTPGGSPDTPPSSAGEKEPELYGTGETSSEQESSEGGVPEATPEAGAEGEAASTSTENTGEGAPEPTPEESNEDPEDVVPEPDDDDLNDGPPVFPQLPEKVATALKDDKHKALKAVDSEIRGAWAKLGQEPSAVAALIRTRQAEWGKSLSQAEMTLYSALKKAALDALKAAGLPSEV